jgi:hypothetical protein
VDPQTDSSHRLPVRRARRVSIGHGETQRPDVQGMPSQQSLFVVQSWPYWAQVGPQSAGGVASGELPSGGGPLSGGGGGGPPSMQGPQMPLAAPVATMQVSPAQQSALTVQPPQFETHAGPPSTGAT